MINRIFILAILIFLFSCDCYRSVEGIIIDADSGLPVNDVQIVSNGDWDKKQTDHLEKSNAEGRFSYSDISGGFLGCPDLILVFSKKGYYNHRMIFNLDNKFDTIYFRKSK